MVTPFNPPRAGFPHHPVVQVKRARDRGSRTVMWYGPLRSVLLSCSGCGRCVETTLDRVTSDLLRRFRRHAAAHTTAGLTPATRTLDYLDSTRLLRSHERLALLKAG